MVSGDRVATSHGLTGSGRDNSGTKPPKVTMAVAEPSFASTIKEPSLERLRKGWPMAPGALILDLFLRDSGLMPLRARSAFYSCPYSLNLA